MKQKHPEEVSQLPTNPFPNAITVVPKRGDDVDKVAALFRSTPGNGIEKVDYGKKTTHKVLRLAHVIEAFFVIAVLLLLAASTLLIANTIRLSIFSRRREIEVMKLVGATNWFVRGPFMLEGVLCGVAGAVGAVVLLILGKEIALPSLLHTGPLNAGNDVRALAFSLNALILVATGLLLGAAGSAVTIRRFLQV
jgi:cell division transport system permease protein